MRNLHVHTLPSNHSNHPMPLPPTTTHPSPRSPAPPNLPPTPLTNPTPHPHLPQLLPHDTPSTLRQILLLPSISPTPPGIFTQATIHSLSPLPYHSNPNIPPHPPPSLHRPPLPSPSIPTASTPQTPTTPRAPPITHTPPQHVPNPRVFDVPPNLRQILDLSPASNSPENIVKQALLSHQPNKNAIALVGMGGAGKTTILRALGRDKDIISKFYDGIWFFQLGHDVKLPSFIRQMQTLVKYAFPDFLDDFKELAAVDDTHRTMINQLMDRLATKRFLLLFDDVWDLNETVFKLVCAICTAVQGNDSASLKILTSTRNGDIADVPTHEICIPVNPEDCDAGRSLAIFCCYASIDASKLSLLSPRNRDALDRIIETCGGLPLALSVAGSAARQVMDPSRDPYNQNGFVQYWESLEAHVTQLSDPERGDRHGGLFLALQSSLNSLEKKWNLERITVGEMFQSFCILQKQMCLPVSAIEKLWGVTREIVLKIVKILARNSIVSLVRENDAIIGIWMHDLVHDLSVSQAEENGGVRLWHARLVDVYQLSIDPNESDEANGSNNLGSTRGSDWWNLDKTDKYMNDNIVWHLLGAERVSEAIRLVTDYRWMEQMNEDEERPPFQKTIAELLLVRAYVQNHEKTETGRRMSRDIDIIVKAMELCVVPYCLKNRKESTFQLYGRLCGVRSDAGLAKRVVWSIEEYGQRPWARAGYSVLTSGHSLLRRVVELKGSVWCIWSEGLEDEIVAGGDRGQLWVMDYRNGSLKRTLIGHQEDFGIVDVFVDHLALIYSCNEHGHVIIWKEYKPWRTLQAQEMEEKEFITCMQVLATRQNVVFGTNKGRLLVLDILSGRTLKKVNAHNGPAPSVNTITVGRKENVLVSASRDTKIRVWNARNFKEYDCMLSDHYGVHSAALSGDGKLLASGSNDGTMRLWDLQSSREVWKSREEHRNVSIFVAFSKDGDLMYSADTTGTICVWKVTDGGNAVSMTHTLGHGGMGFVESIWIGDDSELYVLCGNRTHHVYVWDSREIEHDGRDEDDVFLPDSQQLGVSPDDGENYTQYLYVWDARETGLRCQKRDVFLPHVQRFGISQDEATIATYSPSLRRIEIRNMSEVSQYTDRVISSYEHPCEHSLLKELAVTNDQHTVAYSINGIFDLIVVNVRIGAVLHNISTLHRWSLCFPGEPRGNPTHDLNSENSEVPEAQLRVPKLTLPPSSHLKLRTLQKLNFNPDGCVLTAVAVEKHFVAMPTAKSFAWDVHTGEPVDGQFLASDGEQRNRAAVPHLFCEKLEEFWGCNVSRSVTYSHCGRSSIIGTVEHDLKCAHYCLHSSRLWVTRESGGLEYIDLISENTPPNHRHEPPLPSLSQHHPPPSQNTTDHTTTAPIPNHTAEEQVYDVFISHAGTDKFTIAEPLYHLLVALGFKVFLDKAELRPGQNASQKMINAMKTAKIAVVILSPEFAARMWTLKELMCFLERFREKGERGVIIIPVFYRLTLEDCRDERTLFRVKGEDGRDVFATEGFMEWMSQQDELRMKNVLEGFQSLRGVTGIENKRGVTNGMSVEEGEKREEFVREIASAIVEAKERLEQLLVPVLHGR